jgi:PAS domain S-box-containing protein
MSTPVQGLVESIVEQLPDAVVFADRDGVIRLWNRGAEALFGYRADEALGASLELIVPPRLRAAHDAGFRRAIDAGRTRARGARLTRSLHKDGRKLYVELSFGVVTDGDGRAVGAVAAGRDGSARYAQEQARRERATGAISHSRPAS